MGGSEQSLQRRGLETRASQAEARAETRHVQGEKPNAAQAWEAGAGVLGSEAGV